MLESKQSGQALLQLLKAPKQPSGTPGIQVAPGYAHEAATSVSAQPAYQNGCTDNPNIGAQTLLPQLDQAFNDDHFPGYESQLPSETGGQAPYGSKGENCAMPGLTGLPSIWSATPSTMSSWSTQSQQNGPMSNIAAWNAAQASNADRSASSTAAWPTSQQAPGAFSQHSESARDNFHHANHFQGGWNQGMGNQQPPPHAMFGQPEQQFSQHGPQHEGPGPNQQPQALGLFGTTGNPAQQQQGQGYGPMFPPPMSQQQQLQQQSLGLFGSQQQQQHGWGDAASQGFQSERRMSQHQQLQSQHQGSFQANMREQQNGGVNNAAFSGQNLQQQGREDQRALNQNQADALMGMFDRLQLGPGAGQGLGPGSNAAQPQVSPQQQLEMLLQAQQRQQLQQQHHQQQQLLSTIHQQQRLQNSIDGGNVMGMLQRLQQQQQQQQLQQHQQFQHQKLILEQLLSRGVPLDQALQVVSTIQASPGNATPRTSNSQGVALPGSAGNATYSNNGADGPGSNQGGGLGGGLRPRLSDSLHGLASGQSPRQQQLQQQPQQQQQQMRGLSSPQRSLPGVGGGSLNNGIRPMPPAARRRPWDLTELDRQLHNLVSGLLPSPQELDALQSAFQGVTELLKREFPNGKVHLYGSAANGLAITQTNDIDVCLELGPEFEQEEGLRSEAITRIGKLLQDENMANVVPLPKARVPVVKFTYPATGTSVDVTINNMLPLENTRLIATYASLDSRLRALVMVIKHWAKTRGVNDTYRGTLSSYAYVLLAIGLLQQRSPPILPCLQQLPKQDSLVAGWDTSFCSDLEWLQANKQDNRESLAELLDAFFAYWGGGGHDYNNAVLSIRVGGLISKKCKDWVRRQDRDRHLVCIEDPFELSHDLGRCVDWQSVRVLRGEFERAARIMATEQDPLAVLLKPLSKEPAGISNR